MTNPKKFAIIGAAGYIAPRHLNAIKETGNELIAAFDKHDNVGILDSYFPEASFFTEFERFDRHLEKLKQIGEGIDYITICSPNYLHDAHIRFALRTGANAICEKPMVLNPWNAESLSSVEKNSSGSIFNILQLRLHPEIQKLKTKISQSSNKHWNIDLNYITSRGKWYDYSWKGDISKSGGISTNIGIHFFDMLIWIFGSVKKVTVLKHNTKSTQGILELEKATVNWFLSINSNDLPKKISSKGKTTFRSLEIDGDEFEFSEGFQDLHVLSYQNILSNRGFGVTDVLSVIKLVEEIRNLELKALK